MTLTKNLGMLVLAIWLILMGLVQIPVVAIPGVLLGVLAIIAAILILVGR